MASKGCNLNLSFLYQALLNSLDDFFLLISVSVHRGQEKVNKFNWYGMGYFHIKWPKTSNKK